MLFRKDGHLIQCKEETSEPHYPNCSSCYEKVNKKRESLRTEYEIGLWWPEPSGRHRSVFDYDLGDFTEITFEEYKEIILAEHQHSEFILNSPNMPMEHWDQEETELYTVYVIQCKQDAIYVGQTGKDFEERIKQHESNTTATANFIRKNGGFLELLSIHHTKTRKAALELEKCIATVLSSSGLNVNEV